MCWISDPDNFRKFDRTCKIDIELTKLLYVMLKHERPRSIHLNRISQ